MAYPTEKTRLYNLIEEAVGKTWVHDSRLEAEADERALEARQQVGLNVHPGQPELDQIKHDLDMWEELPAGITAYGENAHWSYQWLDPVGHCRDAWMSSSAHLHNLQDSRFTHAGLGIYTELPSGVTDELQRRWYFIMLLTNTPLTPPAEPTPTFTDVPATHPRYDEIEWMATTGLSLGFKDGTYRPDESVTRGQIAAFLKRFFDTFLG